VMCACVRVCVYCVYASYNPPTRPRCDDGTFIKFWISSSVQIYSIFSHTYNVIFYYYYNDGYNTGDTGHVISAVISGLGGLLGSSSTYVVGIMYIIYIYIYNRPWCYAHCDISAQQLYIYMCILGIQASFNDIHYYSRSRAIIA